MLVTMGWGRMHGSEPCMLSDMLQLGWKPPTGHHCHWRWSKRGGGWQPSPKNSGNMPENPKNAPLQLFLKHCSSNMELGHTCATLGHFQTFSPSCLPPKHSSVRTTAQWVAWAKTEGFVDIEKDYNGETIPGKVYCTFCSKWLGGNSATIKQHCVQNKVGSGDKGQ